MTVNELIEELNTWERLGYGNAPVLLMNLNIQEHEEAEEVNLLGNTEEWQQRAIEIR